MKINIWNTQSPIIINVNTIAYVFIIHLYFLVSLLITIGLALIWKKIYELLAKRILA